MKILEIIKANTKGQVVIPRAIRKLLGITEDTLLEVTARGEGIYIHPVQEIITSADNTEAYLKMLAKTRGTWGQTSKAETQAEKHRKQVELEAAKSRRNAW